MNPHIQRAQMLYQRSRYADAERELGMALQINPHEPWAYALLGACKAAQDDFAKADELGRRRLPLRPSQQKSGTWWPASNWHATICRRR